jgi:hypothetical protein
MAPGNGVDAAPGDPGDAATSCMQQPAVSFQHDVQPLIGRCGGEMCHGGLGGSWPYQSLVSVKTTECADGRVYVKPGDPANSYLIQKLEGSHMCMGVRMPKQGMPLSASQIQTLETWICQGAANN